MKQTASQIRPININTYRPNITVLTFWETEKSDGQKIAAYVLSLGGTFPHIITIWQTDTCSANVQWYVLLFLYLRDWALKEICYMLCISNQI